MAVTSQLIGSIGGAQGYFITSTSPKTYELPPNPNGWSILLARWASSGNISFTITNRVSGEVVWDRNVSSGANEFWPYNDATFRACNDGMNITIRNSVDLRICIASGTKQIPPIV